MPDTAKTPDTKGQVADAVSGNWVDRLAPAAMRPYLRLSRADRPIGTWLLLLPCWWAVLLAAAATQAAPLDIWIILATAMGAFLMRGAGCTWNDIADRDIDARVARTRSRPIPSGQVTARQAALWMIFQALISFAILLTFKPLAIALGIASLLLVGIYPFAKRFTWWPQIFLGLAFNWGALLAWAAHTGTLSAAPLVLYLAGITWTLFYDTIYAHQDTEDDALIGVKSTARLFGNASRRWLMGFMVVTVILMATAIILALTPGGNVLKMTVALGGPWAMGWHMTWQMRRLDTENPQSCLAIFRSNRDAGLLAGLFLAVAVFL